MQAQTQRATASQKISLWDRTGISLSLLCTIHCALLPVLALFLPFFQNLSSSTTFHWVMALIVVPIGILAFARGYRQHRKLWVLSLGLVGMTLLAMGLLLPEGHLIVFETDHVHVHDGMFNQEGVLTLVGSVLLVIAHIGNLRSHWRHHVDGHC